nr:hypothetical protein [Angustibacter aerolatus]
MMRHPTRRLRRPALLVLLAAALTALLSACALQGPVTDATSGSPSSGATPTTKPSFAAGPLKVGIASREIVNDYNRDIIAGAEQTFRAEGATVTVTNAGGDATKHLNNIQTLLNAGTNVLVIELGDPAQAGAGRAAGPQPRCRGRDVRRRVDRPGRGDRRRRRRAPDVGDDDPLAARLDVVPRRPVRVLGARRAAARDAAAGAEGGRRRLPRGEACTCSRPTSARPACSRRCRPCSRRTPRRARSQACGAPTTR